MNTYPGFYRAVDGREYLYLDKSNFFSFERGIWDKSDPSDNHKKDTNITREYLANTKVEIESEEHSRFVQDIVISNGGKWGDGSKSIKFELSKFIVIDSNLKMTIKISSHSFANSENKLVKIPLPPKEPDTKEWPQVGDEVLVLGLESNNRCFDFNGLTVKVLSVTTKHGNRLITFEHPTKGYGALMDVGGWMKKPLTPEEELAEELKEIASSGMIQGFNLEEKCCNIVFGLMNKYDIKKKPE